MELVPILSTIILVGTIATFILAVAAYILYKIRERRARESSQQVAYAPQEPHVLVAPTGGGALPQGQPVPAVAYAPPRSEQAQPQNSLFWEYTDEGFVPVAQQEEERRTTEARTEERAQSSQQDEGYAWL
jgi:hypothetical protein